jgi:hypothetical protein
VTARLSLGVGLAAAALAVGGWKLLLPVSDDTSNEVAGAVSAVVGQITSAEFTAARATLDAQLRATGSYAGAPVSPPVTLVRADAVSYCLEYSRGAILQHLAGPGGTPQPGGC